MTLPIYPCFAAVLISCAVAQDKSELAHPLRKYDIDQDGKLTGDEFTRARQAHNRGGREAEPTPSRLKDIMNRIKRDFSTRNQKAFDKDGDGKLNEAETVVLEKVWAEIATEYQKLRQEITKRYDRNDDGELSNEERDASRRDSDSRRQAIEQEAFKRHNLSAPAPSRR
jgi:Ca2+-binding EF-hand superfamily protein